MTTRFLYKKVIQRGLRLNFLKFFGHFGAESFLKGFLNNVKFGREAVPNLC